MGLNILGFLDDFQNIITGDSPEQIDIRKTFLAGIIFSVGSIGVKAVANHLTEWAESD